MNFETTIPILSKEVIINPFDSESFVVSQPTYNYEIKVSNNTQKLLSLIDGKSSISKIKEKFETKYATPISEKIIAKIFYEKLAKFGIIEDENQVVERKSRASYLKLSFILLKSKFVNPLSDKLSFLYQPKTSRVLVIFSLIFCILFFAINWKIIYQISQDFSQINYFIMIPITYIGIFFHEFGHSSAGKFYGIDSKGIGFGFYLFTPVFFADMSAAWRLPAKQRIIINLGGFYFETLYVTIIIISYFFTQNITLFAAAFSLFISIAYNLDPFLRSDGYWVLSDATNTPNLRKKSNETLKDFIKSIFKKRVFEYTKKNIFLIIYSTISLFFIVFFVAFVLIWYPDSIIYFPINLYNFVVELINGNMHDWSIQNLANLTIPFAFYMFLGIFTFKFIKKKRRKINL